MALPTAPSTAIGAASHGNTKGSNDSAAPTSHSTIGYLSPIDYERQFIAARTLTYPEP